MRPDAKGDWPVRVVLALLVLVFFREALAGGVFFERDIHLIWVPQIEGFVGAVAGGALPLWDPSPSFGQPLLADPQAQVLYPLTWLNLALRPWTYCTVYALAHLLLSTLAFFALARRWGLSRLAAAAGASIWALSGPFLSLVDLWHHFAGASYIPAVFLSAESAIATRRTRDLGWFGLVFALQMLAGSADMCAMTLVALAVWVAIVRLDWRDLRSATGLLARGAAALLLAGAIGAGAWVAAVDAVSRSSRHALPEDVRTYWSLHPLGVTETLLAGVPTRLPLAPRSRDTLSEGREPFLDSLYLGLPCLALVGAAFSLRCDRRRWALAALGTGALLVALGRHAAFYGLLTTAVPPLRILRFPVKAMVIVAFAWAGLAAFGVDAWQARAAAAPSAIGGRRRWRTGVVLPLVLATGVAAVAAALALAQPPAVRSWAATVLAPPGLAGAAELARGVLLHAAFGAAVALLALLRPRTAGAPLAAYCAAIVAVADLAVAHPRPNPVAPAALYEHRPEVLAALGDARVARVYSYDYFDRARPKDVPGPDVLQRLARQPAGWTPDAAFALARQLSLAPETAGRWRLGQAFAADYRGLHLAPLAYLTRLVRLREEEPRDLLRLLRIGAVTHVVAQHRVAGELLAPVAEVPGLFAAPILVLAVPSPLPRARVVSGVRVADGLAAFDALLDPGFDPERTVLLPEGSPSREAAGFAGRARVVEERADLVRLDVEASADGFLVLADTYDPGWRTQVDGRAARLLRANVAFRAVAVPAGRHRVEMVYRPRLVLAALFVSLGALLATLYGLTRRSPPLREGVTP